MYFAFLYIEMLYIFSKVMSKLSHDFEYTVVFPYKDYLFELLYFSFLNVKER